MQVHFLKIIYVFVPMSRTHTDSIVLENILQILYVYAVQVEPKVGRQSSLCSLNNTYAYFTFRMVTHWKKLGTNGVFYGMSK